ncbi:SusC/RagA family TonB-linked outer membrane protein [Halpernia frigidisoli]|uniref:TonB-linked outer membrane protein, SusC/RagA family n=1 Tax=Halpernia frigidisoli TaxID=1125876 RepID=A0A1I3IW17_9FLAO|nr:SusC/RagA family TonB-linked outer membrane protein [Halpernia frigidisoli]SFI52146.1 TonB-linked outer membrane protein, SusC/RagA family [Halpernia frigidisoli]
MKNSLIKLTCTVAVFYFGFDISAQKVKDTLGKEKKIDEVVLIGYGTTRKSDLTGSVAVVGGAELEKAPIANVAQALTGKIAGLTVTTTEGSPDAEINLKVRGGTSISQDNNPLIIVDGFPVGSLNDIPSSIIQNITVLKDASSTAIYGSRGANGVILVTTKAGKAGQVRVTLNGYSGYKFLANEIDVLSPLDYAKWQYEFATLIKDVPSYEKFFGPYSTINKYRDFKGADWQKQIYGNTGTYQNTELGVTGGSSKLNFNINLGHYNAEEIQIGSKFKRDNILLNLKSKVNDKIDLGFTFRYSNQRLNGSGANEQNEVSSADSRLRNSVAYSPIIIPGLVTENPDDAEDGYLVNPLTAIRENDQKQEKKNSVLQGSLGYKIIKNLSFNSNFGVEFNRTSTYRFYGRTTYYAGNVPPVALQGLPSLVYTQRSDDKYRISNVLNYDFKSILGDDHSLKLLIGQEYQRFQRNDKTTVINGFTKAFNFQNALDSSSDVAPQNYLNFYSQDDRLLSFFGRVNYDFKNRYILTATLRADSSSKFTPGNRLGYFPSAALAWKINQENFLQDVSWISLLKMRLSYGQSGNNNIPNGLTTQQFVSPLSGLNYINGVLSYLAPTNILANPNLKWETTTTQNIGLDYEFFKGRISGTLDVYKNNTRDLLVSFPINSGGYEFQFRNIGEVENKGLEGSINFDAIKKKDYGLNFGFNMAFNKNNVVSLGTLNNFDAASNWASTIGTDYQVKVGQPFGLMYGYKNDGRYEVSDFNFANGVYTLKTGVVNSSTIVGAVQPGTMKLKDINGDGKVDISDKSIIGDVNPKFTGGFVLNANVKNFDLSASLNFSVGNDVYNANRVEFTTATSSSPDGQYRNLSTEMADGIRWTNIDPNTGATVTDPTALTALNANTKLWSPFMSRYVLTDWAIEDASFLRLNTLTLGYKFPESLSSKVGLSKIRIYATGFNIFVLTNYSGLDPEVSTRRKTPFTPGVDSSPYPKSRQVVFGFNLNF